MRRMNKTILIIIFALVLFCSFASGVEVGYWNLNSLNDLSPQGNTLFSGGTPTSDSTYPTFNSSGDSSPSSTNFDGNDYLISSSTDFAFGQTWSFNIWVKTSSTLASSIINKQNSGYGGYYCYIVATSGFAGCAYQSSSAASPALFSSTSVNDGTWHMISWIKSTTQHKIYIDGILEDTEAGTLTHYASTNPLDFGDVYYNHLSDYNGNLDVIRVYNNALNQTEITNLFNCNQLECNIISNFSITAKSFWDNSSISSFNATINGTTYSTTNGTITTDISDNSTSLYNITISASDWFNTTYTDYNVSTDLTTTLKQSQVIVFVNELFSNNSISNYTIQLDGQNHTTEQNNITIYPNEGNYTIVVYDNTDNDTFHTTSGSLVVSALDNKSKTVYVHQHYITVSVTNLINGAQVNTYTVNISSLNTITDKRQYSTTNGTIIIPVIHETYNLTVQSASGYSTQDSEGTYYAYNDSVTITGDTNVSFELYTLNSLSITFYDSETNTILDSVNISIEFIGALSFNENTSNGTLYVDLLTPSSYTLSYTATGYRQGSYVFSVTNNTITTLSLYLDADNLTSLALITVKDIYSKDPVKDAEITIQRYINDTWKTEQILITDFNGQSEAWFVVSTEFYNFLVKVDGVTYFGVLNSNENKKVIYAEDIANGITIEIDTSPDQTIFNYQNTYSVATSLNFYNTSNITGYFVFFWDNSENTDVTGTINVKQGNINNCSNTATGETGSITCLVNVSSGSDLTYFTAVGSINGIALETSVGVLGNNTVLEFEWGVTGWMISIFITLLGFLIFLSTPKISVVVGSVVFGMLILFNLIFEQTEISVVILIFFLGFILAKIPRKEGE